MYGFPVSIAERCRVEAFCHAKNRPTLLDADQSVGLRRMTAIANQERIAYRQRGFVYFSTPDKHHHVAACASCRFRDCDAVRGYVQRRDTEDVSRGVH